MYVQDLYAVLHALWVDDSKHLHGFIRVQISLLLLLSAATATRPGAIVESASAKGSNKALSIRNIELMKVRSLYNVLDKRVSHPTNFAHLFKRASQPRQEITHVY